MKNLLVLEEHHGSCGEDAHGETRAQGREGLVEGGGCDNGGRGGKLGGPGDLLGVVRRGDSDKGV